MDKYICGLNDKVVNIYIPNDNMFGVTEWSINFELIDECIEDLDCTITVYEYSPFIEYIYAVFEYREHLYLGVGSVRIGEETRYILERRCRINTYVEMTKEQFNIIKMTIADNNGQQVLEDMFDILYNSQNG